MSEPPPNSLNYCGKCGASTYPDAKYCHNCGTLVSVNDASFNPVDRLTDLYPTYMVTLISIIQAAALGYLLLAAKDQVSYIIAGTYNPVWTVLIVGMFVMIVATWLSYSQWATMLRLVPKTLDALIPFCFGVTQALAIFSISMQQIAYFYFSMSLNALVGLASYIIFYREARLHKNFIENRTFLERAGTFPRLAQRTIAARAVIFLIFGVTEARFNLQSLFFAFVILVLNVWMIVGFHLNTKKILEERW